MLSSILLYGNVRKLSLSRAWSIVDLIDNVLVLLVLRWILDFNVGVVDHLIPHLQILLLDPISNGSALSTT